MVENYRIGKGRIYWKREDSSEFELLGNTASLMIDEYVLSPPPYEHVTDYSRTAMMSSASTITIGRS